jgi:hypothetical protein
VESIDNVGLGAIMDLQEFTMTTSRDSPPAGLIPVLQALWHLRKGDWDRAHGIVQEHEEDRAYAMVHAQPLEDEWKSLVSHFLGQNN